MKQNINLVEINNFLSTAHPTNLRRLQARLARGEWHWLFPSHWENNAANRNVLFHGISATLMPKPTFFGSAGK